MDSGAQRGHDRAAVVQRRGAHPQQVEPLALEHLLPAGVGVRAARGRDRLGPLDGGVAGGDEVDVLGGVDGRHVPPGDPAAADDPGPHHSGWWWSSHHRAMSLRRMNATPGCAWACSMKSRMTAALAAWPLQRAWTATVIIVRRSPPSRTQLVEAHHGRLEEVARAGEPRVHQEPRVVVRLRVGHHQKRLAADALVVGDVVGVAVGVVQEAALLDQELAGVLTRPGA